MSTSSKNQAGPKTAQAAADTDSCRNTPNLKAYDTPYAGLDLRRPGEAARPRAYYPEPGFQPGAILHYPAWRVMDVDTRPPVGPAGKTSIELQDR